MDTIAPRRRVQAKIASRTSPARLTAWRSAHNLNQQEAANLLGISRRTYQHFEMGDTRSGYRIKTVPRLVELAIKGLDLELKLVEALFDSKPPEPHAEHHQNSRVSG